MEPLVLKVKTKSGHQIIRDLNQQHTVLDLKNNLSNKCEISVDLLLVKSGFPPKTLCLDENLKTLLDLGLKSGDTLIVDEGQPLGTSEKESQTPTSNPNSINNVIEPNNEDTSSILQSQSLLEIAQQQAEQPGLLLRMVVPADNSCLFTSVGFVLSGKIDLGCGSYMRQLIVEHVKADPENFNEAILGKKPLEYCQWISKPESWGGAIELSILAKYYGMEIAVVDTVNAIINRFGEDANYPHRVLLIFDGIHYDPLYLENPLSGETKTIFPSSDDKILIEADVLAQESKSSRQFTDVNKFRIKCMECSVVFNGQADAQKHAKTTGHVNFADSMCGKLCLQCWLVLNSLEMKRVQN